MPKLEKLPNRPAICGFRKYKIDNVKIAAAMISIPIMRPIKPIILSKLSMNKNHHQKYVSDNGIYSFCCSKNLRYKKGMVMYNLLSKKSVKTN